MCFLSVLLLHGFAEAVWFCEYLQSLLHTLVWGATIPGAWVCAQQENCAVKRRRGEDLQNPSFQEGQPSQTFPEFFDQVVLLVGNLKGEQLGLSFPCSCFGFEFSFLLSPFFYTFFSPLSIALVCGFLHDVR